MFFYLYKVLFLGFLQFNGNFVDAQNNSKYRDWASLTRGRTKGGEGLDTTPWFFQGFVKMIYSNFQ